MKKIILPVLVILGFIGISFYAGYEAEKNIREQLALAQPYAESQGIELTLHDYQRGVFKSNFVLTLRMHNSALPEELSVTSHSNVYHGPLMIVNGLQWGLFYSQSDISLAAGDDQTNHFINTFFGEAVGQFYVHGHFDGTYTAGWNTAAIDYNDNRGTEARVDGFELSLTGRFDAMDVAGTLAVGAIHYRNVDGDSVEISPVTGEFATRLVAGDIPLSDADMRLDKITFSVSGSPPVVINQLAFSQRQQLQNDAIDSHLDFSIDSIDSLIGINNLYYRIKLEAMPIAAARAWAATTFDDSDFASEELLNAMRLTLSDGLNMQFSAGAELLGGRSTYLMNLGTLHTVQGYSLDHVQSLGDMIHFIEGDAELRITADVVTGSLLILFLAEYIDTYLIRDGDDYVFIATIEEGVLRFADVEFPLAMLFSIGTSAPHNNAP